MNTCSVSSLQQEHNLISSSDPEHFYVGVTYCGDSVSEAKQLIDRVKNYTNLFVIQSGSLQHGHKLAQLKEIIDYAVDSNLHFIVYISQYGEILEGWFSIFDPRWDNYFLGIYFGDELGGKMLDGYTLFQGDTSQNIIEKFIDGSVKVQFTSSASYVDYDPIITYYQNGTVLVEKFDDTRVPWTIYATYHTNGTISVSLQGIFGYTEQGTEDDIPYSLETIQSMYPFASYDETANLFIDLYRSKLATETSNYRNVTYFTSDYALYWYDYLSGYDVVLAQLGWNHTITQDIDLVRGAANLQNKSWGAIITWKYNHPPYLGTGEEIYEQMLSAYEAGAKYVVVFNYAENMTEPYGTLQEEHFVALENFWNDVVQNPDIKQGSIKGETVLVLPENYGWGMRDPTDKIWGLWAADEKSEQIWNLRSSLIDEYGLTLDIVYDDPEFPVEGKYSQIFYGFTENSDLFPTVWIVTALVVGFAAAAFLVYFVKVKKATSKSKQP
jgi:hypothetical protein